MDSEQDVRGEWYAWLGWAVMLLATAAIILHDSSRSVVPAYREAAAQWMAGRPLYDLSGVGGFTYFPHAAILFVPFALLPTAAGEIAWRLTSIAVFALALRELGRILPPVQHRSFPLLTLVALPLVWDCARNGQATLIMTAFMLLAVIDFGRQRFWRSTLWLGLAVAVKPLAIVLVLLLAAVDRRMTWRVLAAMTVVVLVPFATRSPSYVLEQYARWFRNTRTAAHVGVVSHGWTTPFTALRVAGIDVPERVQTVIRMAGAAATLVLCWLSRRRHDSFRSAFSLYTLTALYLILLSPRTENNTYAMLAPVLGVLLFRAFYVEHANGEGILLAGIALGLTASRALEKLIAPGAEQIWLSPLLASCLTVYVLVKLRAKPAHDSGRKLPDQCCGSRGAS